MKKKIDLLQTILLFVSVHLLIGLVAAREHFKKRQLAFQGTSPFAITAMYKYLTPNLADKSINYSAYIMFKNIE